MKSHVKYQPRGFFVTPSEVILNHNDGVIFRDLRLSILLPLVGGQGRRVSTQSSSWTRNRSDVVLFVS